ncbi:MAG: hypothetical protein EOM19_04845 [Candidatus Moranbacteria bacterium]|nr:hypothetical protein [Candidatus Moranbacteria bacterium]
MKKEKGLLLFVISILFVFVGGIIIFFVTNLPSPDDTPDFLGKPDSCQALSCHGTDIQCGVQENPIQCTEIYQIGDSCRQYAHCQMVGGACMLIKEDFFDTCVSCVEKCEEKFAGSDDSSEVFLCENSCIGTEQEQVLLRACPEEKIINAMPTFESESSGEYDAGVPPREYFILNGQRREIEEFDREWVEENCSFEEQVAW